MARLTIALLGDPIINEDDKAAEAITPGHLVTFDGSGNLIKHNVAAGRAAKRFALERDPMVLATRADAPNINVAYGVADQVRVGAFHAGCRVNALVAAAAPAIAKGDWLESAGDGTVRKALLTGIGDLTDSTTGTANDTVQALPDPTDSPATADALRDDLVATLYPALRNNFADLAAKVNAILPGGAEPGLIGMALEAVDNSAGGAAVRIRIEIL